MRNKINVYEKVMAGRVVAILRKIDTAKIIPLIQALHNGGIQAMEITMDTPGALDAIGQVRREFGDRIAIGAGTVLDPETGRSALLAGAQFLVAPNLNANLIRLGNRYGCLVMPGCATATEVVQAYENGADIVKIFPAAPLGAAFIKQIKGPLDHITVMATGGIGVENAREFREAGADVIGVGGNLVNKTAIASGNFAAIRDYAAELVSCMKR